MKFVHRLWPFVKADYKSAEAYLEEQSKQGFHIDFFDNYGITATYQKGDPKDIKYCIDYYTDGRDELEGYMTILEDAGWNFVCYIGKFLVFSSEQGEKPPRIFTGEYEELKRIRKGLWKYDIPASMLVLFLAGLSFLPLAFESELDRISCRLLFGSGGCLGLVGLYRSLLFCFKSILAEKKNKSMNFSPYQYSKFWGELIYVFFAGAGVGLFCTGLTKVQLSFIGGNYLAGVCVAIVYVVVAFWLLSINILVNHCNEKTLKVIHKVLLFIVFSGIIGYLLLSW